MHGDMIRAGNGYARRALNIAKAQGTDHAHYFQDLHWNGEDDRNQVKNIPFVCPERPRIVVGDRERQDGVDQ